MVIPKDYSIGVGGETEMMNESMASLGFSMVIAIAFSLYGNGSSV